MPLQQRSRHLLGFCGSSSARPYLGDDDAQSSGERFVGFGNIDCAWKAEALLAGFDVVEADGFPLANVFQHVGSDGPLLAIIGRFAVYKRSFSYEVRITLGINLFLELQVYFGSVVCGISVITLLLYDVCSAVRHFLNIVEASAGCLDLIAGERSYIGQFAALGSFVRPKLPGGKRKDCLSVRPIPARQPREQRQGGFNAFLECESGALLYRRTSGNKLRLLNDRQWFGTVICPNAFAERLPGPITDGLDIAAVLEGGFAAVGREDGVALIPAGGAVGRSELGQDRAAVAVEDRLFGERAIAAVGVDELAPRFLPGLFVDDLALKRSIFACAGAGPLPAVGTAGGDPGLIGVISVPKLPFQKLSFEPRDIVRALPKAGI